jgi:hypothetical protein
MAEILQLVEGCQVSLVRGSKTYRGIVTYDPADNGRWYVKLENAEPDEPTEISIHILKEVGD